MKELESNFSKSKLFLLPRLEIRVNQNDVKTFVLLKDKETNEELKVCDFPLYMIISKELFKSMPSIEYHDNFVAKTEVDGKFLICFSMMNFGVDYLKVMVGKYQELSDTFKIRVFENTTVKNKNIYSLAFNPEIHYDNVAKHYGVEDVDVIKGMDLVQPLNIEQETLLVEKSKLFDMKKTSSLA